MNKLWPGELDGLQIERDNLVASIFLGAIEGLVGGNECLMFGMDVGERARGAQAGGHVEE